jgi:uncharacterized membrane protein YbhN (UPF0104 family)
MNHDRQTVLLSAGLICAFAAGIAPLHVVPHFAEMYIAYGWALPLATRLLLDYYAAFLAVPILAVLIWQFWPNRAKRSFATAIFGIAGFVLVIAMMSAALYLPFSHSTPTIQ